MPPGFVHLHVHSEYSLVDSTVRVGELVKACARADMPAVALTDVCNLFALVKFHKAAEANGIKPIAGSDLWIANPEDPGRPHRLTVLCRDREGYRTLSRLLSRAYAENRHGDRALVDPRWLEEANAGLIALAGQDSDLGDLLLAGRDAAARERGAAWRSMFADRLYLEVTRIRRAGEESFLAAAIDLADRLELPVIASNDVRFLRREDFDAHEARVCIHSGCVLADPKRPREYTPEQYLKSPGEMAALFADLPELLENTVELARRCNLELSLGTYYLPAFPVPEGETLASHIRAQAHAGLDRRLAVHELAPGFARNDYENRLDTELGVIEQMGFPGYFLIVADFINWAKSNGIPVGPGRGSGAGSLVAWALGITDLDPLRYGLLFERFLNPERISMPDFDVDFCMDRRDEVIDYVARKYGRDRVSQIITYGTMAAKAVLRDTGRVLGMPYGQVDRIAKLLPRMPLDLSLEDALGRSEKSRKEPDRVVAEFVALYETDEEARELIDLALKLEDLTRNAGKHAGGVVIAPEPLHEFVPLYSEGGAGVVTQFDKDDVEAIGLVKFDFLGLRTLTIIDWAVKAINVRRANEGKAPLDIAAIRLDDAAVYREIFAPGNTGSVFQFESPGMRRALKNARPDRFEDLIALNALYRPGPMDMIPSFVARKHGTEAFEYPDPRTEGMLRETYGIMVYQEQVMQMAQIVGGYSLGGADLLRRAMGKKKAEEMARERVRFREGAARNGLDEAKADQIFDLMEKFAGYGFNKSHAAAYSLVAYQTAWLKLYYPAEFMAATLSSDMDNTDKVVGFLDEARGLGLTVLPPQVNASAYMFEAVAADTVRYGLGAIKGVGRGLCEAIVAERERGGPFADLLDFCRRVDSTKLNRRALEAMIQAGALDALGRNRATLMLQLPEVMKATDQLAKERAAGQVSLFGMAEDAGPALALDLPQAEEWPLRQRLDGERDTLGHYLSGHPFDPYRDEVRQLVGADLGELDRLWAAGSAGEKRGWRPEVQVVVAGLVTGVRRKGDSQLFVMLEDGRGRLECSVFSDSAPEFSSLLVRDRVLVVQGGLREDEFSGGFSLRLRQCWDYEQLCAQYAQRLSLRLDLRDPEAWPRVDAVLARHRPGPTPLRLHVQVGRRGQSATGVLDLNGSNSVRVAPPLLDALRAQPGVRAVKVAIGKPWAM